MTPIILQEYPLMHVFMGSCTNFKSTIDHCFSFIPELCLYSVVWTGRRFLPFSKRENTFPFHFTAGGALCPFTLPSLCVSHHRLLPPESAAIPVPPRIHLRLRRHELPHRQALLPGPHLHDRPAPCCCARRSG